MQNASVCHDNSFFDFLGALHHATHFGNSLFKANAEKLLLG